MARSRARLEVVGGKAVYDPREADQELAFLFTREAELERQLRGVRRSLEEARQRFAKANDLRANPRMELLRTRFGPQQGSAQ